ncbi:PREDICTED: uncharacterized protein LOC104704456 [Camelina sativa]|uniref:Uncharacterized protein LOC104704456 n=1 Tax=Camelina sativa TaxID=90675 RepID=A0ABM0T0D4_CAMSA|nr:PREDICTED: uncharacterized protein LOC104704456 [Camelina sativa]
MVGTRSQPNRVEDGSSVEFSEAKTVDEAPMVQILNRTEALELAIAEHNKKIDRNITDMFDMIKMIPKQTVYNNDQKNSGKGLMAVSATPGSSAGYSDQQGGRSAGYVDQQRSGGSGLTGQYHGVARLGKVDFPRFDGVWVTEWLGKVEDFFSLDGTPCESKVRMASIHFDSHVATWHHALVQTPMGRSVLRDWGSYKLLLKERFENVMEDPIADLKNLQETDGIVDYHQKFELIKTRVSLSEEYLVSAYLAGLRLDTQMHIRMFQPQSVRQCLVLGRLYEKAHPQHKSNTGGGYNSKPHYNGSASKHQTSFKKDNLVEASKQGFQAPANRNFLSQEEMSDRRAKGLCFICDEKYTPDHYLKHKKSQVFMIEVEEEDDEYEADETQEEKNEEKDNPRVSISSVSGVSDYMTMKVKGVHNKKDLEKLGVTVQSAGVTRVTVADGSKLGVQGRVSQFQWSFQGTPFKDGFMLILLGGCDMVLGAQWLAPLGDITWNLQKLEMGFWWKRQKMLLHGIKQGAIRTVKATKFNKKQDEAVQISMICAQEVVQQEAVMLYAVEISQRENANNSAVLKLKSEYSDIFEAPTSLPPFIEEHNHKIVLKSGSDPVNQRPYRYATYQKDEIDKIVRELLFAGTIRVSSSPFSSPLVLVKKKDGNWRLCVDYRRLNGLTIKNRLTIPLIKDLLDELGGSAVFSKIDLRAGYHQVRMEPEDIHKTAFKSHNRHFEYLVMPFGLTNAPATFQGLMNAVLKEFLRKFVLVFFDDILVYSSTVEDHIVHLKHVFHTMRQHHLFAKESKCAFATDRVEYLGHFIAVGGVSTNPKVNAVADWPTPSNVKQLHGFFGFAGYYRRFVKNFGTIARPLTVLTKKDAFLWSQEASAAFKSLKDALCQAPVLALPLFDKPFVVETDACTTGIGAVLMQEDHPLAFINRHLKGRQLNLSIYKKELLAVVFAVQKWRHYLLPNHFVIKTDQRSLKYLLEQRLNTPIQQQ